ncbi:MAG: CoA-binding protein [Candidatus Eisenbacteria bacterium]
MNDPERAVIILGASEDRSRFANKAVRAHLDAGFRVYPVHPTADSSEGIPTSRSIAEVPGQASLLLLYVRPAIGLEVIDQAPAKGVRRVLLNPGSESAELITRIEALGMEAIEACSIVALGRRPSEFPA